jgi:cytochrome c-type biogenesis protein
MPIGLALIAGGLSTLNPCGFSLLPAMLSPYVSRDAADDPSAISRLGASLRAGGRVTAGFLSVFIVVGVPIVYGLGGIVRAMPWAGAVAGLGIMIAGLLTLSGRHIGFGFNAVLHARPRGGVVHRARHLGGLFRRSVSGLNQQTSDFGAFGSEIDTW